MNNGYFVFPSSICKNIHKESFYGFFRENKIQKIYENSGQEIEYFITDMIREGVIEEDVLNEFLFNALFYGHHKDVFVWKIASVGDWVNDENILKYIIKDKYEIQELNYNKIASTFFVESDVKKESVAAIKLYKENDRVEKFRIIFVKETKVMDGESILKTHSYIPIEVNLDKNLIITKGYHRSKMVEEFKYDILMQKFTEEIKNLLSIDTDIFGEDHNRGIYNMCKDLVDKVFKDIVDKKGTALKEAIDKSTELLTTAIDIRDINHKMKKNNIFNVKNNIDTMIEHILVSDYFHSFQVSEDISGFDGLVTYIKFSDGTNVKAVIKGENSCKPVFKSEAFMGLRKPIENKEGLSELVVIWNHKKKPLRVKYDAGNLNLLKMHVYVRYDEGDFYYALDRYEEFESQILGIIQGMDTRDTDAMEG